MRDLFNVDHEILVSCREWLAERNVCADDLPDEEVIPRVQVRLLTRCSLYPGGWDKRFVRNLTDYPEHRRLSPKQIELIGKLWLKYRRQLRLRNFSALGWPAGLPRPSGDHASVQWTEVRRQALDTQIEVANLEGVCPACGLIRPRPGHTCTVCHSRPEEPH